MFFRRFITYYTTTLQQKRSLNENACSAEQKLKVIVANFLNVKIVRFYSIRCTIIVI